MAKHEAECPCPNLMRCGTDESQRSAKTSGQRVWNTHPEGRSSGLGMSPGIGVSGSSKESIFGRALINPRGVWMCRRF